MYNRSAGNGYSKQTEAMRRYRRIKRFNTFSSPLPIVLRARDATRQPHAHNIVSMNTQKVEEMKK